RKFKLEVCDETGDEGRFRRIGRRLSTLVDQPAPQILRGYVTLLGGIVCPTHAAYFVQSETRRALILENSLVLPVTSTAPRLTAVPAISRSIGPITMPCDSRSMRIRADSLAAA